MNRRHLDFNEFLTFRGFNPQLASIKALTRFLKMQFFSSFLCNIREEAIWFPFSTHRPRSATCKLWGGAAPQSVRARPRICRIFPHAPTGGWAHCGPHRPPNTTSQIPPTCKCFPNQTHPDLGGSASWSSWLFAHLARRSPRTEKEEDANQKPLTAMKLISRRITTIIIQSPPSSSS